MRAKNTKVSLLISIWIAVLIASPVCTMGFVRQNNYEPETISKEFAKAVPVEIEVETSMENVDMTTYYNIPLEKSTQKAITRICEEKAIDPKLIFAMAKVESDFDSQAIGDEGSSFGLLQIQTKWWDELVAGKDLLNPVDNVDVATDILVEYYKKYETTQHVLSKYNSGRVDNTTYYNKVMEAYESLEVAE